MREAEAEADKVRKEKADIVQKWTGAVLNIAKRDEVGNVIFSLKASFRFLPSFSKKNLRERGHTMIILFHYVKFCVL